MRRKETPRRQGYVNHGLSDLGKFLLADGFAKRICPLHLTPLPPRKQIWCGEGEPADGGMVTCGWAFHQKYSDIQDWKVTRARVIRRDGGKCVNCGTPYVPADDTTKLEVDHIREIQDGGIEFDLTNLRTLCHACHSTKTAARRRWKSALAAELALRNRVTPFNLTMEKFL